VAGKAGIMVNPYDVEEILQAINGIIDNPDLKRNLKIEGLKQSQKFSWKSAAEKTLKVYESVLC
jgi:glycosyltransferase involved in cell wall biosynthesis